MALNLFDHLDVVLGAGDQNTTWVPRAPFVPRPGVDLLLIPQVRDWRRHEGACGALARVERDEAVAEVVPGDNAVQLRISDAWIARIGRELVEADPAEGRHRDLVPEERLAIYFWGANTTKALHVGHLRNLAIGHAISAAKTVAGAAVERRSLMSDVGRGMGEAMAGVVRSGKHLNGADEIPGKTDHFVGDCYASYIKASRAASDHEVSVDSLERESVVHNDSADTIINRVLNGDPSVLKLWTTTRAWVLAGHRKTLSRLGIDFDRVIFESDFLSEMAELSETGLRTGTLDRRHDGVVIYRTGRSELEEMPLVRPDGLSTQHMRALAYWTESPELDDMRSVQVCGTEWTAHVTCRTKLMHEMAPGGQHPNAHPTHTVFHGMVNEGGRRLASSQEGASLIDDLIEQLDAEIDGEAARRAVRARVAAPDDLAARVAMGYFLLQPAGKAVDFDLPSFLEDGQSLGWDLARAQAQAADVVDFDGPRGDDPTADVDYRFAVIHSEVFRRHLRLVIDRLDVLPIAKHASHLARWSLEAERPPHVAQVLRVALGEAAQGLGLGASA